MRVYQHISIGYEFFVINSSAWWPKTYTHMIHRLSEFGYVPPFQLQCEIRKETWSESQMCLSWECMKQWSMCAHQIVFNESNKILYAFMVNLCKIRRNLLFEFEQWTSNLATSNEQIMDNHLSFSYFHRTPWKLYNKNVIDRSPWTKITGHYCIFEWKSIESFVIGPLFAQN